MKRIIVFIALVLSSCTASLVENQLDPQSGENPYIEIYSNDYLLGDLLLHKNSRLVIKFSCQINEIYLKGIVVDGGEICSGYAGRMDEFIICHECTNYCN